MVHPRGAEPSFQITIQYVLNRHIRIVLPSGHAVSDDSESNSIVLSYLPSGGAHCAECHHAQSQVSFHLLNGTWDSWEWCSMKMSTLRFHCVQSIYVHRPHSHYHACVHHWNQAYQRVWSCSSVSFLGGVGFETVDGEWFNSLFEIIHIRSHVPLSIPSMRYYSIICRFSLRSNSGGSWNQCPYSVD